MSLYQSPNVWARGRYSKTVRYRIYVGHAWATDGPWKNEILARDDWPNLDYSLI